MLPTCARFMVCALAAALLTVLAACGEDGSSSTGAGPMPAPTRGFNGRFHSKGSDPLALVDRGDTVDLTMSGETVAGRKTAPGRVEGEGKIAGGRLRFVLTLDGEDVRARFTVTADDGRTQDVPEATYARVAPDPPGLARDARLVAHWRHTETHVSGEFSYVQDTHLVLEADGTMSTWDRTRSTAGGEDSAKTNGSWKTEGSELYFRVEDSPDWHSAGRYGLTDTHMMLTRGGSKTIYERL